MNKFLFVISLSFGLLLFPLIITDGFAEWEENNCRTYGVTHFLPADCGQYWNSKDCASFHMYIKFDSCRKLWDSKFPRYYSDCDLAKIVSRDVKDLKGIVKAQEWEIKEWLTDLETMVDSAYKTYCMPLNYQQHNDMMKHYLEFKKIKQSYSEKYND